MRTFPDGTTNKNVPKDVFLIAETERMSGEIIETYYATEDGKTYGVTDWSGNKPHPAYMNELCRLTGDTEQMLELRYRNYFQKKEKSK